MVSPVAKDTRLRQSPANRAAESDDDSGKTENYESLNLIGSGAYGSVYRWNIYGGVKVCLLLGMSLLGW